MSSSPLLSPSEVFKRKPPFIRTGSRAAPIPQNASASFTTASSLLSKPSSEQTKELDTFRFPNPSKDIDESESAKPAKTKVRKTIAKKSDNTEVGNEAKHSRQARKKAKSLIDGPEAEQSRNTKSKKVDSNPEEHAKAARKPRAKKVEGESTIGIVAKEKTARKPRVKKADGEIQSKLSTAKITKASSNSVKDTEIADAINKSSDALPDPFNNPTDFGLVQAVKRRTTWTPPTATAKIGKLGTLGSVTLSEGGLTESSRGFKDLFGSFGFINTGAPSIGTKSAEIGGARKRKLIELVKTNPSATPALATVTAPKEKMPKKKARTITERATSAYASEGEPEKPAPILQYFSHQITQRVTDDGFKIPGKPRSKSPVKKSGKGAAQAPILLSPESALKQVGNQDFVFGTSSQLAKKDSPTLLRDIHAAMQASNKLNLDDPFADSPLPSTNPQVSKNRGKVLPSATRNLWSAAARDITGELLDVEMVDLVDSPAVSNQIEKMADSLPMQKSPVDDEPWHNIEEVTTDLILPEPTAKPIGPIEAAIRDELMSSPSRSTNPASSLKSPKKKKQSEAVGEAPKAVTKSSQPGKSQDARKPDYTSYTTAQLTKEIASYRFKPVKNRDQMILLLEKCWESKQRMALGTLGTNKILKTSPEKQPKFTGREAAPSTIVETTSPKRPRGRPRKDSIGSSPKKSQAISEVAKVKPINTVDYLEMDSDTPLSQIRTPEKLKKKSKQPVEEISDSDTSPTPPRRRPSQIRSPPLPLQLSASTNEDSPVLSPTSTQVRLFKHITQAVNNAPRAKDNKNPSWHEKILLYDPIIIEDLTVWLNTGALDKVGWDGEVEPKEVKRWCESKSICCLWKENLRGGARSRY